MMKKQIIILVFLSCFAGAKVSPRGLDNALDISASGVIANRIKAQILAENIANIDTTETETGLPYRKKTVILKAAENFKRRGKAYSTGVLNGVVVADIAEDKTVSKNQFQKIYDPTNPAAGPDGFIYYPNIDLTQELVEMTKASGAFENNVVVFNNTKSMMQSSLEIGQ